jgi:hypothetical protein
MKLEKIFIKKKLKSTRLIHQIHDMDHEIRITT